MEIKKVGVVGFGSMGSGIVQVSAQAGYQVTVSEINDQLLARGFDSIKKFMGTAVERGKMTQKDMDATLGRIKGTTNSADFKDCDIVIEVAIENMDLKKKIFADLDKILPKQSIIATNTSCLSIIDLAMVTKRPTQVIGTHFFNPVPLMKLLEIIPTIATSNETLETAQAFGKSLNKTMVLAKDTPGFIVNRLLLPYLADCALMLQNGVATREDIDAAVNLGLNYPMGPFTLMDFVGIDIVVFVLDCMYEEFKDPKFVTPTILRKMVTAGWLGRKTGKGFYDYTKK